MMALMGTQVAAVKRAVRDRLVQPGACGEVLMVLAVG